MKNKNSKEVFQMCEKEFVKLLAGKCHTMSDIQGLLKNLFKDTVEQMLEAEMTEHLGYDKYSVAGKNSGNNRNGYNQKTLKAENGNTQLLIPRDRNGEFEPMIVEKHQSKTEDLENRIIAMYAKGLSNRDIEDHLKDIYGIDVSAGLISRITDKIMPQIQEWQSRPLNTVYPIVFLDGIYFKVRKDAKIVNKCVYSVLGINFEGIKEVLGLWISENESASFWLSVCNELKNRGVQDILIACHDNLPGFSSAIQTVFPHSEQQLCIIHQIRNSTKFVSYKDLKSLLADLKQVYGAPTLESAEYNLEVFREKWNKKYPQILKLWDKNWAELSTYFKYPEEIRKLIYTTNSVEGFHRQLRKFTKTKTIFPNDDALKKSVFLSIREITKKWSLPIPNWGIIIGQLTIFFEDRVNFSKL